MRIVASSFLGLSFVTLIGLTGCVSLHAKIPEDAVRQHIAREDGIELSAICSLDGRTFSEGALVCMAGQRLTCDPLGRWAQVPDAAC